MAANYKVNLQGHERLIYPSAPCPSYLCGLWPYRELPDTPFRGPISSLSLERVLVTLSAVWHGPRLGH